MSQRRGADRPTYVVTARRIASYFDVVVEGIPDSRTASQRSMVRSVARALILAHEQREPGTYELQVRFRMFPGEPRQVSVAASVEPEPEPVELPDDLRRLIEASDEVQVAIAAALAKGRTWREIAVALGVPAPAVRQMYGRSAEFRSGRGE